MAEASAEALTRALSLLNIRRENSAVVLKPEQETAINNLLNGRDIMAILPTGFGKSMIYTVFALAKEEISSSKTCVIVIAPLKSIIDDQISEPALYLPSIGRIFKFWYQMFKACPCVMVFIHMHAAKTEKE